MDPIKKAAVVINDYMMDFLDTINQFPTKDMDTVRQVVGHWPLVKQLLKGFTQEIQKSDTLDPQYVKTVLEEFKQAAALLDKLEGFYKNVINFDLEGIKTHTEPLLKLIERAKGGDQEQAPIEPAIAEEPTDAEPEQTDELKVKAAKVAQALDDIADKVQEQEPLVALALDRLSDAIVKS